MAKTHLLIFGTRPEAIKMAPVYWALKRRKEERVLICSTGQHREMLKPVLDFFELKPDYELDVMKPNQPLGELSSRILLGVTEVLQNLKPDVVYVHGDTTTSMAAALAAFYQRIPIAHVEAGLRTGDLNAPFPEEANRRLTAVLATWHFAPVPRGKANLCREGVYRPSIYITGNTVVDALLYSVDKVNSPDYQDAEIDALKALIQPQSRIILVTAHRRESYGEGFEQICKALQKIAKAFPNDQIIYPVHLNPKVQEPVRRLLADLPNVQLIEPLAYPAFVWLMNRSYLILTDSGGVQEEAPSLGKPVLVLRDTTERPDAINAGTALLVGTDAKRIFEETKRLLKDQKHYQTMSQAHNPYGQGDAGERIARYIV